MKNKKLKLLAFTMLVVSLLTSCFGKETTSNDDGSTQGSNEEVLSKESQGSGEEISNIFSEESYQSYDSLEKGDEWTTWPDIVYPEFDDCEVLTPFWINYNGKDYNAKVVVSPFSINDYDIEKTKNELKKNELFSGWIFGEEESETGLITTYNDVGNQTAYQWHKAIVATKEYNEGQTIFSDLVVKYEGKTNKTVGYSEISVKINIPIDEVTFEIQEKVYDVLHSVFSYKYNIAEILCFSPYEDPYDKIVFSDSPKNGGVYFTRKTTSEGLEFIASFYTGILGAVEGYSGNGEYTPKENIDKHIFDVFSDKMGDFDLKNYDNIASDMLSKYYTGYTKTMPGISSGYTYKIVRGENGHEYVCFDFNGLIGQEGVVRIGCNDLDISIETLSKDGIMLDLSSSLKCGVGFVSTYYEEEPTRLDMFERAMKMFETLTKESFVLTDDFVYNEDEKKYNIVKKQTNILGIDKEMSFVFDFYESAIDAYIGYIYIDI